MFSITAKFKEHSIKFRILVIVLPVVILSYIILLSSFYMIYVKESRNNILLEHDPEQEVYRKINDTFVHSLYIYDISVVYINWNNFRESHKAQRYFQCTFHF